jgi:hypothetical protein
MADVDIASVGACDVASNVLNFVMTHARLTLFGSRIEPYEQQHTPRIVYYVVSSMVKRVMNIAASW